MLFSFFGGEGLGTRMWPGRAGGGCGQAGREMGEGDGKWEGWGGRRRVCGPGRGGGCGLGRCEMGNGKWERCVEVISEDQRFFRGGMVVRDFPRGSKYYV